MSIFPQEILFLDLQVVYYLPVEVYNSPFFHAFGESQLLVRIGVWKFAALPRGKAFFGKNVFFSFFGYLSKKIRFDAALPRGFVDCWFCVKLLKFVFFFIILVKNAFSSAFAPVMVVFLDTRLSL